MLHSDKFRRTQKGLSHEQPLFEFEIKKSLYRLQPICHGCRTICICSWRIMTLRC